MRRFVLLVKKWFWPFPRFEFLGRGGPGIRGRCVPRRRKSRVIRKYVVVYLGDENPGGEDGDPPLEAENRLLWQNTNESTAGSENLIWVKYK